MPWKRNSEDRTNWKRVSLMLLAAFVTGMIACCISSRISRLHSGAVEQYSIYSAVKARYPGQNLNELIRRYQSRGRK